MTLSLRRRFDAISRERLKISSWCLTLRVSATVLFDIRTHGTMKVSELPNPRGRADSKEILVETLVVSTSFFSWCLERSMRSTRIC